MLEKIKLKFSKRRKLLLGTVGLFVILAVSSIVLWQSGKVAEAAVLDPHPGLVGWWRFDEGTGTVAGESSGNGNNGTINGATWVAGNMAKHSASTAQVTMFRYLTTRFSISEREVSALQYG